jgi:hypothetical protein
MALMATGGTVPARLFHASSLRSHTVLFVQGGNTTTRFSIVSSQTNPPPKLLWSRKYLYSKT